VIPSTTTSGRSRSRGVSTTLGYVLALGITAVLVTGLLVAGGSFLDDQRDRVVREELQVIGQQMVSGVEAADRLAVAGSSDAAVAISIRLPARVAESGYSVELVPDGGGTAVQLTADNPDVTVTAGFVVRTAVDTGDSVRGGDVVVYVTDADALAIRGADP